MWAILKKFFHRSRVENHPITQEHVEDEAVNVEPIHYDVVASFLSDVGCQREINEDNGRYITPSDPELLSNKGMLFVVADGMGGHSGGEIASRLAVDVITRTYYQETADVQTSLKQAIQRANSAIFDEAFKNRTLYGMGTTCTALVLKEGLAFSGHVGDSRLYLVRNNEIYLMTEDHSAVMQMVRRGLLNLKQARHHPDKNVILRALGSHATVEITTWNSPFPAQVGDQFLLCSDGLYDLVEDEEIKMILLENQSHQACEKLIALAKERGGHDNITVGIISLEPKAEGESKPIRDTRGSGDIKMIGYLIGNYRITEKIGEGGMGDVFKGIDIMLEREVAIKMLRTELARQQPIVERFRTEAITLAKLNHPNIATLYNFVRQGNDYFMVMEYVKGHTFENIIKKSGAMPYQRAVQLFAQGLEGIAHAHKLSIIHRDIKPANVMLMDSGLVKVMDFGIARVLGSNRMTQTGNMIGTIEYMSPEQIRGAVTDARSDVYGLGILLYEMLTGRLPFESDSEYELMRRQVEEAPIPPRVFTQQIPLAVEQVIMRALAKKPEARFQTADEFRAVLLKSFGDATAKLVALSVSPEKKRIPETLDSTAEPPKIIKERRLPDEAEAQRILKETRLAEEAKADLIAQQIKETRLANQHQVAQPQNQYRQQIEANSFAEVSNEVLQPHRDSPIGSFINRLNWKHYVAAVLLAVLSIPVAFLASSSDTQESNTNQSARAKNVSGVTEQKKEPAAQPSLSPTPSAPPSSNQPVSPDPISNVGTITPIPSSDSTTEPVASTSSRNNKKARHATSQPSTQTKKRNNDNSGKKEEKKDEKKGGIFNKVKGGLKKINPFKKDKG